MAFNVTTGETIAVKQMELPDWNSSKKIDPLETSAVEAIKQESEILKDLDHPNIVEYLGTEETPLYFSMCAPDLLFRLFS